MTPDEYAEHVAAVVDQAPPVPDDVVAELSAMLRPTTSPAVLAAASR